MNFKLKGYNCLIRVLPRETFQNKAGLFIPETANRGITEIYGIVELVGDGIRTRKGARICPEDVKQGDMVVLSKFGGTRVHIDGDEYRIIPAGTIIAVLEGD